tara:strand:+ start:25 stop:444 length:420 start_codon:yes stop_codon:yes gene_type:complete
VAPIPFAGVFCIETRIIVFLSSRAFSYRLLAGCAALVLVAGCSTPQEKVQDAVPGQTAEKERREKEFTPGENSPYANSELRQASKYSYSLDIFGTSSPNRETRQVTDDPEYAEYLEWKRWQEFKAYQEWKRQQESQTGS